MARHNEIGKQGEVIAAQFLEKKGYKIIAQNWRHQKGELDIISTFNKQIVIVEVKTRTSDKVENPKEAVTISKQKRIVKAADAYIQEKDINLECRFDIIAVLLQDDETSIEHIEDAFYPLL